MSDKYVCPKCKSQLKVYKEYLFEKQQLVHPRNGQVNKKVINTKAEKVDMPGGLQCTKCDFIYYGLDAESNGIERKSYGYLNDLFEILKESKDTDQVI